MAVHYPQCEWVIAPWLSRLIVNQVNVTERASSILEEMVAHIRGLPPCESLQTRLLSDQYVYSLVVLYCLVIPVGVVGNLLVAWLITSTKKLHKSVNFLLLSLAISDLTTTLCLPWTLMHNISYDYVLGQGLCKAVTPIQGTAIASSIYILVLMAVERHHAVVYPKRKRFLNTHTKLGLCIALVWVISFALQIPLLVVLEDSVTMNDTIAYKVPSSQNLSNVTQSLLQLGISHSKVVRDCVEAWSQDQAHIYSIALLTILYALPLVALVTMYARIGYVLSNRPTFSDFLPAKAAARARRRRQLLLLFVLLVVSFAVLWGPFFILHCFRACIEGKCDRKVISYLQWLGHANVAVNPILYAAFHQRIRETFLEKVKSFKLFAPKSNNNEQT